ncbi:MAG TPA: hypothetical protein DCW68_06390 [Rhodospirillaceae bacterium]|nr:MAG: hypothetical protein A2018_03830 [Alphaproteobacteria bacterium GWF2_58_20]HAU29718.1 hypothetical protein [Rhodospirillaceae bacterium]
MADVSVEKRLKFETNEMIVRSTPPIYAFINILFAAIIVFSLRNIVSHNRLFGFFLAVSVGAVYSLIIRFIYLKQTGEADDADLWGRILAFGAFMAGIAWGGGAVFIFPPSIAVSAKFFIPMALVVVAAGATIYQSVSMDYVFSFLVSVLMPMILWTAILGGAIHFETSVFLLMTLGGFLFLARNNHDAAMESIRMRMKFDDVESALQHAQEESRSAREHAEQAARVKSEFLASISHELRTPMNGVLGMSRLLSETSLSPLQKDYVDTIRQSGETLIGILDDVLSLSRMESGKMDHVHVDFEPHRLLDGIVTLMEPKAQEKGLVLYSEVAENLPEILHGDTVRLRQVLMTLINNALRFTEVGSVTLKVSVQNLNDEGVILRFDVMDTGIGIPEDIAHTLFEPFNQEDSSFTKAYEGVGFGLSVCKRLVTSMGGDIGIDSTVGQGSSFWFSVHFDIGQMVEEIPEMINVPAALLPLRVLLVEDNVVNQKVAKAFLERNGHTVTVAADGETAVNSVRGERFDMVVMDVHMPRMDGLEAARRIRSMRDEEKAGIPIVAITASVTPEDVRNCLSSGMDDFVPKPIDPRVMQAAMERAWAKHSGLTMRIAANEEDVELLDEEALKRLISVMSDEEIEVVLKLGRSTVEDAGRDVVRHYENNEIPQMASTAHMLKGAAADLGLRHLTKLALAIDKAAQDVNHPELTRLLPILPRMVEKSLASLDAWRKEPRFSGSAIGSGSDDVII